MFTFIINLIPANIGWLLVGALGMLTLVMACKLIKLFTEMWREYHEED